jgi:hypothetical protein
VRDAVAGGGLAGSPRLNPLRGGGGGWDGEFMYVMDGQDRAHLERRRQRVTRQHCLAGRWDPL